MGRLATLALVILGVLWVPLICFISTQIYIYMQSVQAYISPPIAAVFLLGVFWPRANSRGALAALLTGLGVGTIRLIGELVNRQSPLAFAPLRALVEINFLHFAILLFVICVAVLVLVSLATAPPPIEKLRGLTFRYPATVTEPSLQPHPRARRQNIVFSVILAAIVITLWLIFF